MILNKTTVITLKCFLFANFDISVDVHVSRDAFSNWRMYHAVIGRDCVV